MLTRRATLVCSVTAFGSILAAALVISMPGTILAAPLGAPLADWYTPTLQVTAVLAPSSIQSCESVYQCESHSASVPITVSVAPGDVGAVVETVRFETSNTGLGSVSVNGAALAGFVISATGKQFQTSTLCAGTVEACASEGYSATAQLAMSGGLVTLTHILSVRPYTGYTSFVAVGVVSVSVIYSGTEAGTATARVIATPSPTMRAPGASQTGPTSTPFATRMSSADVQAGQVGSVQSALADFSFADPTERIRTEIQSAVDAIDDIKSFVTEIQTTFTESIDKTAFAFQQNSPFRYMRGFWMFAQEFEWVGVLAGWFVVAFLVIMIVSVFRFIVSFWGVVERIISVVKLIPGI